MCIDWKRDVSNHLNLFQYCPACFHAQKFQFMTRYSREYATFASLNLALFADALIVFSSLTTM